MTLSALLIRHLSNPGLPPSINWRHTTCYFRSSGEPVESIDDRAGLVLQVVERKHSRPVSSDSAEDAARWIERRRRSFARADKLEDLVSCESRFIESAADRLCNLGLLRR